MASSLVLEKLRRLNDRELDVLRLLCKEAPEYKDIAGEVGLSEGAVKVEMKNIYVKLGIEHFSNRRKDKEIFQIYCPALGITPIQWTVG